MKVKVWRQESASSEGCFEVFDYDGPKDISISALLDHLNYNDNIIDENGKETTRIQWECSCQQGVCGACAMVINGRPALACDTFLSDLKEEDVTLRPLRKFPVVRDLTVDRSLIQENLMKTDIYIGEYQPDKSHSHAHQYAAAKCLKCGLCLEVCPNYVNGKTFFGAVFANDCFLVSARNRSRLQDIKKYYSKHFGSSCSKSLACEDVCPMNIPTLASIATLNRRILS